MYRRTRFPRYTRPPGGLRVTQEHTGLSEQPQGQPDAVLTQGTVPRVGSLNWGASMSSSTPGGVTVLDSPPIKKELDFTVSGIGTNLGVLFYSKIDTVSTATNARIDGIAMQELARFVHLDPDPLRHANYEHVLWFLPVESGTHTLSAWHSNPSNPNYLMTGEGIPPYNWTWYLNSVEDFNLALGTIYGPLFGGNGNLVEMPVSSTSGDLVFSFITVGSFGTAISVGSAQGPDSSPSIPSGQRASFWSPGYPSQSQRWQTINGADNVVSVAVLGVRFRPLGAFVSPGMPDETLPSPDAWYRASDLGLDDGDEVTTWSDSSPNRGVLQKTTTIGPIYESSSAHGLPAVYFDGSSRIEGSFSRKMATTNVLFAVLRTTPGNFSSIPIQCTGTSIRIASNGTIWVAGGSTVSISTTIPVGEEWRLFVVRARRDGTSMMRSCGETFTASAIKDEAQVLQLPGPSIDRWVGRVAEIMFYDSDLTDADIDAIERHLFTKYDIRCPNGSLQARRTKSQWESGLVRTHRVEEH